MKTKKEMIDEICKACQGCRNCPFKVTLGCGYALDHFTDLQILEKVKKYNKRHGIKDEKKEDRRTTENRNFGFA